MLKKTPDNTVDKQESELMYYQTNQPKVLSQGTNEQSQIIILQTPYGKTLLSKEVHNIVKFGKKKKECEQHAG